MRRSRAIALFCLAIGVRLLYLAQASDSWTFRVLIGDGRAYDAWAREIAAGNWYGSDAFYQAPLYPYLLAAIHAVLGEGPWAVRLVQVVLGSAACVLVAQAGSRFFDERTGWLAGLLLVLYAPAVYFDGIVQKASLTGFLVALLVWCLGEYRGSGRALWPVAAGLTLGLLALTRENALLFAPIVALWLAGRRAVHVAWFAGAVALVLVPVALRNQAFGGGFAPTTTQLGPNFYIGNHAGASGYYAPLRVGRGDARYERRDATEIAERARGRTLSAAEVSDYWLGRALDWIRSEPAAWLRLTARKALLVGHAAEVMDVDSLEAWADESSLLCGLGRVWHFGVLVPLGILGAWCTRARWRELWLLHAMALGILASTALFFVMGRYRFPAVPVLVLFAAAALVAAAGAWQARRWKALGQGLAALVALLLACNWPIRGTVDPRVITAYSVGQALVEQGRHDDGRGVLLGVIERDPEFAAAHWALGDSCFREGRIDEARAHFERAVEHDPRQAPAWTGLGMVAYASGATDAAVGHFRRAIEIDPGLAAAHNNLAAALARLGRLEEAAACAERAAAALPGDADVLANLGQLRRALGDVEGARESFTRALAIRGDHDVALAGLERLR